MIEHVGEVNDVGKHFDLIEIIIEYYILGSWKIANCFIFQLNVSIDFLKTCFILYCNGKKKIVSLRGYWNP